MKPIDSTSVGISQEELRALVNAMSSYPTIGPCELAAASHTPYGFEFQFTSDKGNGIIRAVPIKGSEYLLDIAVLIDQPDMQEHMLETWKLIHEAIEIKRQKEGIIRKVTPEREPRTETVRALDEIDRCKAVNEREGRLVYNRQQAMLKAKEVGKISRNTWKYYDREGYDNFEEIPKK